MEIEELPERRARRLEVAVDIILTRQGGEDEPGEVPPALPARVVRERTERALKPPLQFLKMFVDLKDLLPDAGAKAWILPRDRHLLREPA